MDNQARNMQLRVVLLEMEMVMPAHSLTQSHKAVSALLWLLQVGCLTCCCGGWQTSQ